ncbi:MAG: ABC transporter substrate-binding protein [Paenibacillaceae bacterium]|nr:ABC transporter substrate-binding protein [Paenibacillaceae bacterium]
MNKHHMGRVLLAGALSGALALAGCSKSGSNDGEKAAGGDTLPKNFNAQNYPIVNDKITLQMMGAKAPIQGPWNEMELFKEMEAMTNIAFEFNTPPNTNYAEAKSLSFASHQLPDVFFNASLTPDDEVTYGQQGDLIPLEGLIDKYAPNLKKLLADNPDIKKSITTMDGHIYSLPLIIDQLRADVSARMWINGDWMTNLGIAKAPTTTDELYDLLKKFKSGDPNKNGKADDIPLSATKLNGQAASAGLLSFEGYLLPAFGLLGRDMEVKDGKVRFNPVQEQFKAFLAYMNKLYTEKLLDNEAFVQTSQQMNAKGNQEQIGVFFASSPDLVLKVAKPEDSEKHVLLGPLTSPVNDQKLAFKNSKIRRGTFAITSANKYPEATIRWVDYLYSSEGSKLGYLGKSWKWLDDSKSKWTFVAPAGVNSEEYRGKLTPDVGGQVPLIKEKDFDNKRDNFVNIFLNRVTEKELLPYAKTAFPDVYFTNDEQKRMNVIKTDIRTYVDQMEAKFIVGQESLDKWDTYVSTIKKMGLDEMVKINQDAYDRWNASK